MKFLTCFLLIASILVASTHALTLVQLTANYATGNGRVIQQKDSEFNSARFGYNHRYNRIPTVILQPYNTAAVQLALEYAQTNNLRVSIRSGGHSASALSALDDTVNIDLQYMKNKVFNAADMTITAQTGNKWVEMYEYTKDFGVGTPGGSCPSVGIGGLSLGGGANDLSTVFGHTVDNILELEVVLANRTVVVANAQENTDLYWALRGAGHGGFGIVTQIKYKAYNMRPTYYSNWIQYNWNDFEAVLKFVNEFSQTMPNTVNLYFTAWKSGAAATPSVALSCFSHLDPTNGAAAAQCAPFLTIPGVATPTAFPTTQSYYDTVRTGTDPKARRSFTKGSFLTEITKQTIRRIKMVMEDSPSSPYTYNTARLNLYWQGGEMLNRPRNYNAYVHRSHPWNAVWLSSYVTSTLEEEYHDWAKKADKKMSPYSSGEVYQNYPDDELDCWEDSYYAENYPRLRQIKTSYDPQNYFTGPQTIKSLNVYTY
ncbi:hypothetical protein CYY_006986 [Polysphondylium violaceum]|uniref:FAD-binding PCMH-type domain-containing protein n=1 Tax=Polysphondylium violaceum TaxID=133409 RepID=A0A8J4PRL8_9MYCE|nr:hypothetical protein CYY_006986 [Polysphondylium violaceum]